MEPETLRKTVTRLRKEAGLSQAELATRLSFTDSRLSRLESGELTITLEDAVSIGLALHSQAGQDFADYLTQEWVKLDRPSFDHISRETLWEAERTLRRLDELRDDPELRNAFLRQVKSCIAALMNEARFIQSSEHPVAFVGSPGVGKTTALCAIAGLRRKADGPLGRQMVLQTGSGRITICEVHVRNGGEFNITVDPCTHEELRAFADEFCDYLLPLSKDRQPDTSPDGAGLSAEVIRSLRNMTGLAERKEKGPDGEYLRTDPARALVEVYPDKDDLLIEVLSRMDMPRRRRTSISHPRDSSLPGKDWLARTFAQINFGRHPEFSLPRCIEISVPYRLLGSDSFDIRLIDSRGLDEPSAPRRDIQSYLDDDRAIILLCSSFKDAPDAAIQAIIQRSLEAGLGESLLQRGLILILPKNHEEAEVLDNATGEPVADIGDGRITRSEQVRDVTLRNLGFQGLPVAFLDAQQIGDGEELERTLLGAIGHIRARSESRIRDLIRTVDRLIANKANEQARAVFEQAVRPIHVWLSRHRSLGAAEGSWEHTLANDIDSLRWAASLRASVNRRGHWHNFDYWAGLGFAARRDAVRRTRDSLIELRGLVDTQIEDPELEDASDYLRRFREQLDREYSAFYQNVQALGETAFAEELGEDLDYWSECQNRWGQGDGYKNDIRSWTSSWFSGERYEHRHEFVEQETSARWSEMIDELIGQLSIPKPAEQPA